MLAMAAVVMPAPAVMPAAETTLSGTPAIAPTPVASRATPRPSPPASISLIGAVQQATVSVMNKDQPKTDYLREYDQPFELTGTGEITDDGVHVHVTLAGEDLIVAGTSTRRRSRTSSSGLTSLRWPTDATAAMGIARETRRAYGDRGTAVRSHPYT
jgi:hypothetical protein